MIYLLAYQTNDELFIALNNKGQFVGSETISGAVDMLPKYNLYNENDIAAKNASKSWEYSYKACIVIVPSLKEAFEYTHFNDSAYFWGRRLYFTRIKIECEELISLVSMVNIENT